MIGQLIIVHKHITHAQRSRVLRVHNTHAPVQCAGHLFTESSGGSRNQKRGVPRVGPVRPCARGTRSVVGERERAYLVVSTADFSLYILYITGAGRHHTVMFYVILNTRTNMKFHKGSTKLHALEAQLFVMDAAQQSSTHRSFSRTGPVGLEPPKQPTEVSMLIRKVGFK